MSEQKIKKSKQQAWLSFNSEEQLSGNKAIFKTLFLAFP
jgi:hypothetical protein